MQIFERIKRANCKQETANAMAEIDSAQRHCEVKSIGSGRLLPCLKSFKSRKSTSYNQISQKPAQNIIEFVFVFTILIFITLVIFEVALFWQDVNAVYNLNSEINANVALVNNSGRSLGQSCPAADAALAILEQKDSGISLVNPTYTKTALHGSEPFALYRYTSSTSVHGNPQTTLWVDCRSPFEEGITTQIEFYHKTIVIKATIPRFDKPEGIEIIPDNVFIASPKLNTTRHY